MAFYNVQAGDAPVLKSLADEFSMSDNFHQSFMGGTGANHVMLGAGDAIFWSDGNGNAACRRRTSLIRPTTNTDNVYTVTFFSMAIYRVRQPVAAGIAPIRDYLASLPYNPDPKCKPGRFYMINNDSPGFLPDAPSTPRASLAAALFPPSIPGLSAKLSMRRISPGLLRRRVQRCHRLPARPQ